MHNIFNNPQCDCQKNSQIYPSLSVVREWYSNDKDDTWREKRLLWVSQMWMFWYVISSPLPRLVKKQSFFCKCVSNFVPCFSKQSIYSPSRNKASERKRDYQRDSLCFFSLSLFRLVFTRAHFISADIFIDLFTCVPLMCICVFTHTHCTLCMNKQ